MKKENTMTMLTVDGFVSEEERDAFLAEVDARDERARAAHCEYRRLGCDGDWHDGGDVPQNWSHRVGVEHFDLLDVEIGILGGETVFRACTVTSWSAEWLSSEVREHATEWENYPAFLRRIADKLDELNNHPKTEE
jgi:hypothetical protein